MHSAVSCSDAGSRSFGSAPKGVKAMTKKTKGQTRLGGLVAAMMPGAKIDNKGRVSLNIGTSTETLIFNIGGEKFETFRSTLYRQPNSPLAEEKFLKDHFRPEQGDYFFDRDPNVFRSALNYLRTGELHLPSYLCGPAAKNELEYWGIQPNKIERCCWTNYNDWNSTLEALNQLEQDRVGSVLVPDSTEKRKTNFWARNQPKVHNFLNAPTTSLAAKIFGFVSLSFVMVSIFSFLAETTETFAVYRNYTISRPATATPTNVSISDGNSNLTYSHGNGTADDDYKIVTVRVTHPVLAVVDAVCLTFFTVEYFARVLFAVRRLQYVTSVMGVIDLLAILPDYIELIVFSIRPELKMDSSAIDFLSIFRVIRVLRIFRMIHHVPGLWILIYTLKASSGELVLLTCFMSVGILIFSSLIYFVEDKEHFQSIPHSFWWALITMTTVGYGDMYPHTGFGKLVGSVCAMSGLLMVGFSVPALVNNFMLYYKHVNFALQADREEKAEKKRQDRMNHLSSPVERRISEQNQDCKEENHSRNSVPESLPLVTVHEKETIENVESETV